jgi:pyridoxal phosphate enzyme (YggS family)
MTAAAADVATRLHDVRRRVADAGSDPDAIRIVAVTKGFGNDAVAAANAAGLLDIGENYAQELLDKTGEASPDVRWHFLGVVQRNKVARLSPWVRAWHGLDRQAAADAVAKASPGVEVFVEVNVSGVASRPGCAPEDVDALVAHCRTLPLDVSGLMAVGPTGDLDGSRQCFRFLARRARELGLRDLSMGMSDDFEVAVAEGATTLRLGRVLFGPRPRRGKGATIGFGQLGGS